jgi:hypothetical protein
MRHLGRRTPTLAAKFFAYFFISAPLFLKKQVASPRHVVADTTSKPPRDWHLQSIHLTISNSI